MAYLLFKTCKGDVYYNLIILSYMENGQNIFVTIILLEFVMPFPTK